MGMCIDVRPTERSLRVTASGRFSLAEAKRTFLEVLDAVALHRSEKVLLDGRALRGKPATIERFYYGEFAAASIARLTSDASLPPPRFAYVLKEPILDPGRFGETVARNRGMNVRAFRDPSEALAWLGENGDAGDSTRPKP